MQLFYDRQCDVDDHRHDEDEQTDDRRNEERTSTCPSVLCGSEQIANITFDRDWTRVESRARPSR